MSDLTGELPQVGKREVEFERLKGARVGSGYSTELWSDERLQVAAQGLVAYEKLIKKLAGGTSKKFLDDPAIQNCFLGISPVQHFMAELSQDEVEQINRSFAVDGDNFFAVSYTPPLAKHPNTILINIDEAGDIMKKNHDLFRGVSNCSEYLKTKYRDYLVPAAYLPLKIHDQRHGILSGFPRKTVDLWSKVNNGISIARFTNRANEFGVGDSKKGVYFGGFDQSDVVWANEAVALRDSSGIENIMPAKS